MTDHYEKPEVVAYATHHDEPMLFPNGKEAAAYCEDGEGPVALIRLSDYEVLQAENERLAEALRMMVEMVEMDGFGKGAAMDTARAALDSTAAQADEAASLPAAGGAFSNEVTP